MEQELQAKAQKIKLAIFDIDGVFTDGKITYNEHGAEIKSFHVHDGIGIKLLMQSGIEIAIITSRQSPIVSQRMQELGVKHVYQDCRDKLIVFKALLKKNKLTPDQVAFVGDDLPDLAAMQQAGLGIAVANSVDIVREHADWQTQTKGGKGAVREVCEMIMQAQNTLTTMQAKFLLANANHNEKILH